MQDALGSGEKGGGKGLLWIMFGLHRNSVSLVLSWTGAIATCIYLVLCWRRGRAVLHIWSIFLGIFLLGHMTHTLGAVPPMRFLIRPEQCRQIEPKAPTPRMVPHVCMVTGPISDDPKERFKSARVVLRQRSSMQRLMRTLASLHLIVLI